VTLNAVQLSGGGGGSHNLYLSLKVMKCVNKQQNKDILLSSQVIKYDFKKLHFVSTSNNMK
jgi:hypothetical protein